MYFMFQVFLFFIVTTIDNTTDFTDWDNKNYFFYKTLK